MSLRGVSVIAVLLAGAALVHAAGSSHAEGPERQREWWVHARHVLFTDLELSREQARGVDAIIEAQLATRARLQELDAQLAAARRPEDAERSDALRAERRAIREQLEGPHELMQKMRALLAEAQRSTFDMNRARLVAEGQKPRDSGGGNVPSDPKRARR